MGRRCAGDRDGRAEKVGLRWFGRASTSIVHRPIVHLQEPRIYGPLFLRQLHANGSETSLRRRGAAASDIRRPPTNRRHFSPVTGSIFVCTGLVEVNGGNTIFTASPCLTVKNFRPNPFGERPSSGAQRLLAVDASLREHLNLDIAVATQSSFDLPRTRSNDAACEPGRNGVCSVSKAPRRLGDSRRAQCSDDTSQRSQSITVPARAASSLMSATTSIATLAVAHAKDQIEGTNLAFAHHKVRRVGDRRVRRRGPSRCRIRCGRSKPRAS